MITDVKAKAAKPKDKGYRIADTGGLHLFISPQGGKLWRMRYELDGKEKLLSFGAYPGVSIAEARTARDDAKKLLRAGRDPAVQKKVEAATAKADAKITFEVVAREWHGMQKRTWSEKHAEDVLDSLVDNIFSKFGDIPIREVTPRMVLNAVREIEERPAIETARRVRQRVSAVFVYGIATEVAEFDPAASVQQAMAPLIKGRFPAITDLQEVREMLAKAEAIPAHPVTKLALRLLALTVPRPGTLLTAPWAELAEIDKADPIWKIPPARMKLRRQHKDDEAREHWIPLSTQALDVIEVLKGITSKGEFVFPNSRHAHKPMSENAIGYLLNRAGYNQRHVPHGWRSTFSTIMNEKYPKDRAIIDLMLAHVPKDKIESTYNRAAYMPRRRQLAQLWADLLLKDFPPAAALKTGPQR